MALNFKFDVQMLASLIGGQSALDIPNLNVQSLEQAHEFLKAYGYDIGKAANEKKLWNYHRRAVTYINSELLVDGESLPESLSDPNQLKNLANILIYASTKDNKENSLQRWACALLKVIHVLVHLDNDLFSAYSMKIQDQILKPFEDFIFNDPIRGVFLGNPNSSESISLKKFDVKTFKSSDSSVTKLLAKPDAVAFTILDKVGVRFTTKYLFDVFQVLRFLLQKHLVSFPHNIADQANNTLYPLNLFLEVIENFPQDSTLTQKDVDRILREKLVSSVERAQFREKLNLFSSKDYSFVKFITRRLIRINVGDEDKPKIIRFFYPFEVQIIDYESYLKNLSGEASHEKYKARQKMRARLRVLGRENL